jgi:hypothetical protein
MLTRTEGLGRCERKELSEGSFYIGRVLCEHGVRYRKILSGMSPHSMVGSHGPRSLFELCHSAAAKDPQASASFSAPKILNVFQ